MMGFDEEFTVPSTSVVGTWIWDVKKDRVYSDARLADYFGLTAEQGRLGNPIARYVDAMHSEDQRRVVSQISGAVAAGTDFNETYRVHTKSFGLRTIAAAGQCFRDEDGAAALYPGYAIDLGIGHTADPLGLASLYIKAALQLALMTGSKGFAYLLEVALEELPQKSRRQAH